jgi:hypothetical protein
MFGQTPERWFIIEYHMSDQSVHVQEFDERIQDATSRYAELEASYRDDRSVEVVLVGADSIETIMRTHSHYWVKHETADVFAELARLGIK